MVRYGTVPVRKASNSEPVPVLVPVFNCQVVLRFDTLSIFLLNFDVTLKFSTLTYFYINCTYEKILKSSLSVQKFNEISDTHLVDMIRQK